MATFLQLVKDTARESGVMPGYNSIVSVVGQTSRVALYVGWVRQAYRDIQTMREDWRWLHGEFQGTAINGLRKFAPTDLGITADRFGHWIVPDRKCHMTCYPVSSGPAAEEFLQHVSYDDFRRRFRVGLTSTDTGRPAYFAIDPQDNIVLYPTPDGDHVLRGTYYKAPQTLTSNTDKPEMPVRFHDMIMWGALVHMCTYDEAFEQIQVFENRYLALKKEMINRNTPDITLAGPLA